jgi:hypothetical protein
MKVVKFILCCFLISYFSHAQSPQSVIEDFLKANGISNSLEKTQYFKQTRIYKEGSGSTDYTEEISIADSKYHKKKSILDRDFYYIMSASTGFIKIPTGSRDKNASYSIKDFSAKEKNDYGQELKDGLWAFIDYEKKGYIATLSSEAVANVECHKIILEKEGLKRQFFFSKTNHQLLKESHTQNGINHTYTHTAFKTNASGFILASESIYINSKDNKTIKVLSSYNFDKVLEGLSFSK